jgi:phosphomannomutase
VLEMLARRRKKLSELTAELSVYSMVKDKVTLGSVSASAVLAAVQKRFAGARVDVRDGLHLAWKDGWLHVRASNTEPVLRILAEAPDAAEARERVRQVKAMARGEA